MEKKNNFDQKQVRKNLFSMLGVEKIDLFG